MSVKELEREFTAVQARICGTKTCFRCMRMRPIEGGELIRDSHGTARWACARCVAKRRAQEAPHAR